MEKILAEFGVQPILLAAQVVNFLILLFLLKKFLYGPILKVLQKRKDVIAESLKNAREIEERLKKLELEEEKRILKASEESQKILKEASDLRVVLLEEAKKEAEGVARKIAQEEQGRQQMERDRMMQEIQENLAELVAKGLKIVAGKALSEKDKRELVDKSLKNIS